MLRIIHAAMPASRLDIKAIAHGLPDSLGSFPNAQFAAGNGFFNGQGIGAYSGRGISGNGVADSRQGINFTTEDLLGSTMAYPWGGILIAAWRVLQQVMQQQGTILLGFGGAPNVAPPHTNLRTDATIKRAQILWERDAGGTIRCYLVICDAVTVSAVEISLPFSFAAGVAQYTPTTAPWLTLLWRGDVRRLELYVGSVFFRSNSGVGVAWANKNGPNIFGMAEWGVPVGSNVYRRYFGLSMMPVNQTI